MSKATITFDLSIPEDAYDYKCSMKGMDACILLEQIQYIILQYRNNNLLLDNAMLDIAESIDGWVSP